VKARVFKKDTVTESDIGEISVKLITNHPNDWLLLLELYELSICKE